MSVTALAMPKQIMSTNTATDAISSVAENKADGYNKGTTTAENRNIEDEINNLISMENEFWGDIDVKNASIEVLTNYIISKRNFIEEEYNDEYDFERRRNKKKHHLIYMVRNKENGYIYIGQHMTLKVFDTYFASGVGINYAKIGKKPEDFERKVLFDFDTFSEMNDMEGKIVTNDFKNREDTYNRIIGGMQMESPVSRGKVMCHNNELRAEKYFFPRRNTRWMGQRRHNNVYCERERKGNKAFYDALY